MFEEDNIISIYSDEDALEDGVLVAIPTLGLKFKKTLIDRMTRTVYEHYRERDTQGKGTDEEQKVVDVLKQAVAERLQEAYDPDGDGYLIVIPEKGNEEKLWLVQNERNNYTLMFPEDY